jgi:hypothetical protein
LTFTSKPTVVCPSGKYACTASMPARPINPIIDGVDSTPLLDHQLVVDCYHDLGFEPWCQAIGWHVSLSRIEQH